MATLHTVNKSPFANQSLLSCLAHAKDGDTVLMIEDGVFGAASGTGMADAMVSMASRVSLVALQPDLSARGIATERLLGGIKTVDYSGFVELAASHDRTQAWL